MQPAWKSFSPSPPPAWWPSWQSRTSRWQAWDAPSQKWNSLVVQRSRVSWQHQAPSKHVAKNWGKGKVGTCWSRSKRTSSSGTFLLPSFAQAITLLGWTCNNHTIIIYFQEIHTLSRDHPLCQKIHTLSRENPLWIGTCFIATGLWSERLLPANTWFETALIVAGLFLAQIIHLIRFWSDFDQMLIGYLAKSTSTKLLPQTESNIC